MKFFILITTLLTISLCSFANDNEAQLASGPIEGSFLLPAFQLEVDKDTAKKYKGKQLTVLYAKGREYDVDNFSSATKYYLSNIVRQVPERNNNISSPHITNGNDSTSPIFIPEGGGVISIPAKKYDVTFNSGIDAILSPYNFVIFMIHDQKIVNGKKEPTTFYWTNPVSPERDDLHPAYKSQQISTERKMNVKNNLLSQRTAPEKFIATSKELYEDTGDACIVRNTSKRRCESLVLDLGSLTFTNHAH